VISQLGSAAVLLALMTCAVGAPLGYVAGASRSAAGLQWTRRMALAFALFMILAAKMKNGMASKGKLKRLHEQPAQPQTFKGC